MSDIVERLRSNYSENDSSGEAHMALEAADEIKRLRAYQNETALAWSKLTESQEAEIERLRVLLAWVREYSNDPGVVLKVSAALESQESK